jgi:wyosine [tRNA(Phe)-imidazoG37] synthetase (radical SAM superfamily)
MNLLSYDKHSRNFRQYRYVYPVVSRRAAGVSLGINLNTNNACNWRCVYCQVENLIRGKPEPLDLVMLEDELDKMLAWILRGDFIKLYAPVNLQRLNDICLSGNGESTLAPEFMAVCNIISSLRRKHQVPAAVKTILISNGSEINHDDIQCGLRVIAANSGEVWFKIDRATAKGIAQVNQVNLHLNGVIERFKLAASCCPTLVQSCWFKTAACDPDPSEAKAFIQLMLKLKPEGVLLYSTARNPALPEGQNISPVSVEFLQHLALQLKDNGIKVNYYQ